MGFFLLFFLWAALYIVAELLRPKPKFEDARPSGLGDFRFPTATEGRPVPLVWGRVKVEGPNVVWYGDLRNTPIVKNQKTGVFSSDDVTVGYRYYLGLQMAICRGEATLKKVWIDDRGVFSGTQSTTGNIGVNQPSLFGGDEFGTGGVYGTIRWYIGSSTETVDTYLDSKLGVVPHYRGTAMAIWSWPTRTLPGYIGNATSIQPWAFEVERLPDGLGMASYDPGSEVVNGQDCNPMNVIYEIMTDIDWGLSISPADIDLPNFREAGSTLASEGNGFSMVLDGEREASEMISEVARQVDGAVFFDRNSGLWKINLARDDYVVGSLDIFDESNIIKLVDYARQTWEETTNQVRILFANSANEYKDTYALAQDMANVQIQGGNISADMAYPGIKNAALANQIVWRDLKTLSYPLAKINFTIDRTAFKKTPGDVFKFSWARLGISEVVFRLIRIDYGTLEDGTISIYAIQDIFAAGSGVFGDPPGTGWTDPDVPPVELVSGELLAFEAPRQIVEDDPFNPSLNRRVWYGGLDPGGGTISFQGYVKASTGRPIVGDPDEIDSTVSAYMLKGSLKTALGLPTTAQAGFPNTQTFTVNGDDPSDLVPLEGTFSASEISSLNNIFFIGTITDQDRIDGEFIGFSSMVNTAGDELISNLYRGLFHTTPKAHSINDDIYFIYAGGNLTEKSLLSAQDEMDVQLRSRGRYLETDGTTDVVVEISFEDLYFWPLVPRLFWLNGTPWDATSVALDTDYSTETGLSLPDGYAIECEAEARNWRVKDPVLDIDVTGGPHDYHDDSPEFDFDVTIDPGGTPVVIPTYTISGDPDAATPTAYVLRNDAIIAVGDNAVMPTTWEVLITARHTPREGSTTYTNPFKCGEGHTFVITSPALIGNDDLTFGGFAVSTWSPIVIIGVADTALAFDIYTALPNSGKLEGRINVGTPFDIVTAGNTTGTADPVVISDLLELRFTQAPTNDQFFDITAGTGSENGYGVLLS